MMNVRFFDRQDESNPCHGDSVADVNWLMARIDELRQRPASFCELQADNGFNLLLGVGQDRGCAQYSAADGSPPYLMLVDENAASDQDYMDFLTANTDTPVSERYCAPIDRIKEVAKQFVVTGARSEQFMWEEI